MNNEPATYGIKSFVLRKLHEIENPIWSGKTYAQSDNNKIL